MRVWRGVWFELREVVWLASVVWGLSIAGVGLAVAVALASTAGPQPSGYRWAHLGQLLQRVTESARIGPMLAND